MNAEAIKCRIRAIRQEMKKKEISCLIITKPANVTYSTGFMGDDSFAVIINGRSFLITDSRYTEQAVKECPICNIIERHESMADAISKIITKFKSLKNVFVESSISVAELKRFQKAVKLKIEIAGGIIEDIRCVKDKLEITAIKKAGSIAAQALAQSLEYIKPGLTESEAAGMLDFQIRKLGSTNSFDTIVAFGPNASRAHHQPGSRKLKKNDTILIDFGATYNGYCSDITRCFIAGRPTSLYQKVYDTIEKAQAVAIKMVKAGVSMQQVDAAAREVIAQSDLPVYGHGTGHGLGLEVHEIPALNPQSKGKLQAGQIITIEPGIYIPGKLGVRIEDDVLVRETGCEILTRKCSHNPLLSF